MARFEAEMHHTAESFEALSRMQYDLFCRGNLVGRSILGAGAVVLGIGQGNSWWGLLLVAYGCYLFTSKYSAARHTAHKLSRQIEAGGLAYPASRYLFEEKGVTILPLPEEAGHKPERLSYEDVAALGEDRQYLYLFRSRYGGYMIPKAALGDDWFSLRDFLREKTKLPLRSKHAPVIRLLQWLGTREKGSGGR